jgi:hypothetical protein
LDKTTRKRLLELSADPLENYLMMNQEPFEDESKDELLREIRDSLDYMLAEGIVIVDSFSEDGEPLYRLRTEEEIQRELDEIANS